MRFDLLTLFPESFAGYLGQSLLKRAQSAGLVDVQVHDIRAWAHDRHRTVDDRPYGGGPGMVLKVEPVVECVEAVQQLAEPAGHLVMLTPQGEPLDQPRVERLAEQPRLVVLCGRYEGFDERIRQILQPQEISVGDYILNGGEVAAMVVLDAVMRLVPGVLGDEQSHQQDSFSGQSRWLDHSHYTRPREYRGLTVPEVLLGGDHPQIAAWRRQQRRQRTEQRRADLLYEPSERRKGTPK